MSFPVAGFPARGCPRIGQLPVICKARTVINARGFVHLGYSQANGSFTSNKETFVFFKPKCIPILFGSIDFLHRVKLAFTIHFISHFSSWIFSVYTLINELPNKWNSVNFFHDIFYQMLNTLYNISNYVNNTYNLLMITLIIIDALEKGT